MLPPIIDVRVLSSVVLTLSVVAVAVAAPDDTTVAMPLAFANVSVVDKLDPVLVLLLDIVDVGAIGTPQPHQGFAGRLVVRSRDVVDGRVGHEQHGHCIDHYGRRIASHIKTWSRS